MIAPDEFRHVLGHFASGVTLLTALDGDGQPTGLTASAFTSVSLEPPLVLVCVDHKAHSYPALRDAGRFAVNILRAEQEALSRRFATSRLDKFDGVAWNPSPRGLPWVTPAHAQLDCTTVSAHVEGDHTILVGRVEHAATGAGDPLLYYRGRYHQLASAPA